MARMSLSGLVVMKVGVDRVFTVVAMVVVVTFRFGIGPDGLVMVVAMMLVEMLVVDMVTITWLSLLSLGTTGTSADSSRLTRGMSWTGMVSDRKSCSSLFVMVSRARLRSRLVDSRSPEVSMSLLFRKWFSQRTPDKDVFLQTLHLVSGVVFDKPQNSHHHMFSRLPFGG